MALKKEGLDKSLVTLLVFAAERDMIDSPLSEVYAAFEKELETSLNLFYSRSMCYDTILYNCVCSSTEVYGELYNMANKVYCK